MLGFNAKSIATFMRKHKGLFSHETVIDEKNMVLRVSVYLAGELMEEYETDMMPFAKAVVKMVKG